MPPKTLSDMSQNGRVGVGNFWASLRVNLILFARVAIGETTRWDPTDEDPY